MKLLPLIALIFLASCGPGAKLKRAQKLIAKAEAQGATWKVDTVFKEIPVFITESRVDSIFRTSPGDTVVIENERLKVVYVRLPGDSVFIEGQCKSDTIIQKVPIVVNKTIEAKGGIPWWWLVIVIPSAIVIYEILTRRR